MGKKSNAGGFQSQSLLMLIYNSYIWVLIYLYHSVPIKRANREKQMIELPVMREPQIFVQETDQDKQFKDIEDRGTRISPSFTQ